MLQLQAAGARNSIYRSPPPASHQHRPVCQEQRKQQTRQHSKLCTGLKSWIDEDKDARTGSTPDHRRLRDGGGGVVLFASGAPDIENASCLSKLMKIPRSWWKDCFIPSRGGVAGMVHSTGLRSEIALRNWVIGQMGLESEVLFYFCVEKLRYAVRI